MLKESRGLDAHSGSRPTSLQTQTALRQLADSASMIVWMTDVHGMSIYLNQSARALFSESDQVYLSDWLQFVHPDDLVPLRAKFTAAKEAQEEYQVEYRIVRSDGTIRWMLGTGAPRFTETGEFTGYNGTVLDVTKQHEAFDRLAKSEAEYRLLAENSSDLICHCAPDGAYLYVSPSYSRELGIDASMFVGRTANDFIHPDDLKIIRDEVQRQLHNDAEPRVIEIRKRHKNGHYVWMGSKIQVMVDPVTKLKTGTVSVSRDITLERQARNERRKSEERFRSLTQLSSDWYWEADEEDRLTFVSDGVQKAFCLASEQMLGKRAEEFAADLTSPELLVYRQKIGNRTPVKNLPFVAKNPVTGRIFHASISAEPIYKNGAFKGYRGVGRDVTAEKETSHQLARLADENHALIENSPDIMVLFDGEGRILRANRAVKDIIGYEPDELVGRHYLKFATPDTQEETRALVETVRNDKGIVPEFATSWTRKDGSIVRLSWALRRSMDKTLTYTTARDVTEAYQTRTELHRTNQRLNTILESIGDAFFSVDKNWRLTYVNCKTAEFVGVKRDAAIGKLIWEVVPDIVNSSVFPYYQHAMRTGENTFFEEYYEPVGAWVDVRTYPHEDGLSVFFRDITERLETERLIRESEQRFRDMIAITPAGYVATDATGIVLDVNPALCKMSGYTRDEFIGQDIMRFVPACPVNGALKVRGGASFAHGKEITIQHKLGHSVHILANLTIKRDADGNALSLTAFVTDITERKQAESQLEQLATHDVLTGLPNRALINRQLQSMLDNAGPDDSITVMFIDLDRFKEVNDSMGHAPGDLLLRQAAFRLQKNMGPGDMIARLGGDEFVVAAHCSDGRNSAATIAEKLLAGFTVPFEIEGQEVFVSASIGISMFPNDARTKELLFQNADTAMYRAKAAGRNNFRFFAAGMNVEAKLRMTLEPPLRRALERGEFELNYQPRIDLKTMAVVGMEALIRWNHPQLGRIAPAEFIPIAEDNGLIAPIGQWVLKEACRQTKYLIDRLARPIHVSVNLSARQLKSLDLIEQVTEALSQSNLPPEMLELELTESALIEDVDHSVQILKRLKNFGVMLSIDDFGTGYSGLSYLKRLPVDILKLDRSFVDQQPEGVSSFEFIKAFVDMAHALKLAVVAEGIETGETLKLLTDACCDGGQGYLFAKPMPLSELETFLAGQCCSPVHNSAVA